MAINCPKCLFKNPDTSSFCADCGTKLLEIETDREPRTETVETVKEELSTGSTFAGRYQIIEELGRGGMGRVYKVLDTKIKEKVALKLIKPEIASDKKTIERFGNELKLSRRIAHRNVCRMFDLGEEKGAHYITMEYVPGEDLKSMLRMMGKMSPGQAVAIGKQICDGLIEAHRLGVIHRDLKPSNIMIDKDGTARIMDFGIARSLKGKSITGSGIMIGTPEYMSPEQVEGRELDQRSDIYSLGIILYELVTGQVPFEGDTPFTIGVKHKSEVPIDPRELNQNIPEDLSLLVIRCLEKEKENRFQSAEEVKSELERIEKGLPVTTKVVPQKMPQTSKEITISFSAKKMLVPVLFFVALVVIGITVWQLFLTKKAVPETGMTQSIAVLPFDDLSPLKDQAHVCEGMTAAIIGKLSRLGRFDVKSRFLVKPYENTSKTPKLIGEELGVANILVGSILFDRGAVRVDVDLIRLADSYTLWTQSYNQKFDGVFSIQSDIAEQIAVALNTALSPEEKSNLQKTPTKNSEAYDLYLRGRWFYDKRTSQDHDKAIEYYERAIDLDPEFVLAYSGLADVYMSRHNQKPEYTEKAKAAALKALELDVASAEAHTSLANIKLEIDWDIKGAEKEFKIALELDPDYPLAHHWYGRLLWMLGRCEESVASLEHALALNPTDLSINRNLGAAYFFARQYKMAINQLEKTYDMDSKFVLTRPLLAQAYIENSNFEKAMDLYDNNPNELFVILANFKMEENEIWRQSMERWAKPANWIAPWAAACLFAELGDADQVFNNLERAYDTHNPTLLNLKVQPNFDKYRTDPRYNALIKKLGLDE